MSLLIVNVQALTHDAATSAISILQFHEGASLGEIQWTVPLCNKFIYLKNICFQCLAIHEREHYKNVFERKF